MGKIYSNQKRIEIMPKTLDIPNCVINVGVLEKAMSNLDGVALKLWLYLVKNQSGFEFGLSNKACESFGITKSSYYRAIDKLIEDGYLVPVGEDKLLFYEEPLSMEQRVRLQF